MSEEPLVLVAEDSIVVRALIRAQLVARGYLVVEAADGEQALARAREARPEAILLDVEMPRMDGFAVLDALKADRALADIPVVFISGRSTADDAVLGLDRGAHDYLRKPFEAVELAARVGAAIRTKRLRDELRAANSQLQRLAETDQLTGLPNRRHLDDQLGRQVSRAARHRTALGVMIIDVDHFKDVNDRLGHQAGDAGLRALGDRLTERLRREDLLGRWGGEEFMVIAPDVDQSGVAALAEALRDHVAASPLVVGDERLTLTVSVGWAAWRGESAADLVRRADDALYAAKAGGRNRVAAAT